MSGKKNVWMITGFVISVSLIVSFISVWFVSSYYNHFQFELLNAICSEVIEQEPNAKRIIAGAYNIMALTYFAFIMADITNGVTILELLDRLVLRMILYDTVTI